jgi:biofilm PGA synthesis N-glycosyltransferase PgaC
MPNFKDIQYVIISPVRDEAIYIEKTLKSVVSQTIKPFEWVIVNDGSSDGTGEIIDRYASQYHWIKTVHRNNRGFRKSGGGVIEAFYEGFARVEQVEWDFIVKLDGDLSFEADYFEKCLKQFQENPRLGICGGVIYCNIQGKLELERNPMFHVRGATKIYRRRCWDAIEGLIEAPGWDTVDEVKANMLGWETKTFLEIKAIQLKPTGAGDGTWRSLVKDGVANYVSGYHPLFMLFKCIKRTFQKPYIVGSLGHFYGFISGYAKKSPRVKDEVFINYIRKQQIRRLTLRQSIWK